MKAVFDTRPSSVYDDDASNRYQYPLRYGAIVTAALGDWVVLRRSRADGGNLSYFAVARISAIESDPQNPKLSYARLTDFRSFDAPVPWNLNGRYAERALRELERPLVGVYLRGRSVRALDDDDFYEIVSRGLGTDPGAQLEDLDASLQADTVNGAAAEPQAAPNESDLFRQAIAAIEAAAAPYAISGLQRLRAKARGLKRTAGTIFGPKIKADDWAHHYGGRDELQFNVGVEIAADGQRAFRAGVAFSFETSRSLPDTSVLVPKVARFNAWLRENAERFSDLRMWHWQDSKRSGDYAPGPIPDSLVQQRAFVFLGGRQALGSVNPHAALSVFDRMLPLYEWVEGGGSGAAPSSGTLSQPAPEEVLQLDKGRDIEGGRWISASITERTLDIYLRHAEIQRLLKAALLDEGCSSAATEVPIGQRSVDLVAKHADELWFFEVKTAPTVRGCLREAIGQLLEYAFWPGATRPARLIVVGEPAMDATATAYLAALNEAFPIPLSYRQLSLEQH